MARWLAAILACVALPLAAAPALPVATDFGADGRGLARDGRVLVVLYSQADCTWCEQARAYLVPMAQEPAWRARAEFRQVNMDRDAALTDFDGRRSTHRAFARSRGVRFAPTVTILDAGGRQVGEAIVGMRIPDFYGQYLEQAVTAAHENVRTRP